MFCRSTPSAKSAESRKPAPKNEHMARSDSEENRSVALYWDFENLHASLVEAKFGEGYYGRQDNRFKTIGM